MLIKIYKIKTKTDKSFFKWSKYIEQEKLTINTKTLRNIQRILKLFQEILTGKRQKQNLIK